MSHYRLSGPLDLEEVEELRQFLAERRAGYLFDIGTLNYYEGQKDRLRRHGFHDGTLITHAAVVRLLPDSIRRDFMDPAT